jgi:hypothetical protein
MYGFIQEKLQFTFKSTKRCIIQIKNTKEGAKMNYPVYPFLYKPLISLDRDYVRHANLKVSVLNMPVDG